MRLEFKVLAVSGTLFMLIYTCLAGIMLWLLTWPLNVVSAAFLIGTPATVIALKARDILGGVRDPDDAVPREAEAP